MEVLKEIKKKLPTKADATEIYYEGSQIIIYAKNPDVLDESTIKEMVRRYKKRIEVRPDSSILVDPGNAETIIKKILPEDVKVSDIDFLPEFNRVIIEADKPGLVIGKAGSTLKEIQSKINWVAVVKRTPSIPSQIIRTVRKTLIDESKDRREFLKNLGKKIHDPSDKKRNWIRLTTLGGFREVGRSAILLQTPESNVLMDCGVNVACDGENAFPCLNVPEFQLDQLDAVVISHAHLDHSGFLPYLYKFQYKGPVYCTAPTRDLMTLLQLDYVDIAQREGKASPYTKSDVKKAIKHCIPLQWGEVTDITSDTRLTLYNSGHILGSSVAHLHIGDGLHNVVYTGDIKFASSRLLERAYNDFMRVETLIIESTYGAGRDILPPRREAENHLAEVIQGTIKRGGKCLIPVLGVGRAQELMVLLDELNRKNVLPNLKVYIDGMIWDATAIHTAYPEFLSKKLRNQIFRENYNPFLSEMFQRVGSQQERQDIVKGEPCAILATSGMLTGGPSVEYLRLLADNNENSLVFVNYQAEGTMGKRLQKGWNKVPVSNKRGKLEEVTINMGIHTIDGFSGHSDRRELMGYVMRTKPKPERVIVGHGEASKCADLASSIRRAAKVEAINPQVLETLRLR